MLLKVRTYGDPCLREKAIPVKTVGPSERMLISSMIEAMHNHKGIGLAAPQVGINQQIFVVDVGEGSIALVNPIIVKRFGSEEMEEGCLSIPDVTVKVKRPKDIVVQYVDEHDKPAKLECSGILARVIQHEYDHLNGKLIVDYASGEEMEKIEGQLKKIEEQE